MASDVAQKVATFFSHYPLQDAKESTILIQSLEEPSHIFYLEKGIVRSYWISPEGTEVTLNMFKPHTFFPISQAITPIKNLHFYQAVTPITYRRAPKELVVQLLQKEPPIVFDLLKRIYTGMEGVWMHIETLITGNAHTKLLMCLHILSLRFGQKEGNDIVIPFKLSESDISMYAGISRETASRKLQKLKEDGIISSEKGLLHIKDVHYIESALSEKTAE